MAGPNAQQPPSETPGAAAPSQPTRWRCMVKGCRIEGVWQPVLPGETYYPSHHPNSHYWQEHYLASEAEYHRKLAEQRERRVAHYKATGEFLPPEF